MPLFSSLPHSGWGIASFVISSVIIFLWVTLLILLQMIILFFEMLVKFIFAIVIWLITFGLYWPRLKDIHPVNASGASSASGDLTWTILAIMLLVIPLGLSIVGLFHYETRNISFAIGGFLLSITGIIVGIALIIK